MPKTSDEPKNPSRVTSKRLSVQIAPTNPQSATKARRVARVIRSEGQTDGSDASDESSDDAPQQDPTPPTAWHRPSGRDAAAYAGWETWKPRRWAWEFLRRNKKFQSACDGETDERPVIALDFRLREFKEHRQEYAVGKKPRFAAGIRSFPKRAEFVKHIESDATLIEEKIELLPSEVLIRFQIAPMLLAEKTSLDYQLDQARRRLKSFAKKLRLLQPTEGKSKNQWAKGVDRAWLLAALRSLDWKATAESEFERRFATRKKAKLDFNHREIADALLGDPNDTSYRSKSLKERSEQGTALLKSAHRLSQSGYLLLRSGKLKGSN